MTASKRALLTWYGVHGRSTLPWRIVRDPYFTVVSEFMLQQTQVDRVVPKFEAFLEHFPSFAALASASRADVLRCWQGLGYNSRAVRLKMMAERIVSEYAGRMPSDAAALRELPGVGAYTAAAIRAFAFDIDDVPIDTNVRRIVHRLHFGIEYPPKIGATELNRRAREDVPPGLAHDWGSAMMDLGAAICTARAPKCTICPLAAYCAAAPIEARALESLRRDHAKKPSAQNAVPFERTVRYARGRIVDRLRALPPGRRISLLDLHRDLQPSVVERTLEDIAELVTVLEREGLVAKHGDELALRD